MASRSSKNQNIDLKDLQKLANAAQGVAAQVPFLQRKRNLYILIAIVVVLLLVVGVIYMGQRGSGGFGSSQSSSSADADEPNVKTESIDQVKNPYKAVDPSTALAPDLATVKKELSGLPVKDKASKAGYSREQFGLAWDDVDQNGCDTRNDILRRDLTDVRFKVGTRACTVITGKLADPYTGKNIEFKRGKNTSTAVQIDHMVALSDAWQSGAQDISEEQRRALANDPENLVAADGPANMQKSDSDAAKWLPSNKSYQCTYVARQVHVKAKYKLWVTADEKKAMEGVLNSCKNTNPGK